jgi:hypothetical protein
MKTLTFAAGLAAGYVLGTRAGREKFDQIVQQVRKVGAHPTVVQAQEKAKDLIDTGTNKVTTKLTPASSDTVLTQPVSTGPAYPVQ